MVAGARTDRRRASATLTALLCLSTSLAAQSREGVVPPERGPLQVERSLRVAKGEWLRPALSSEQHTDGTAGVIVLEGARDVVLDLRGVTLRGATPTTPRDELSGFGLVLRDCRNVAINGGAFTGYRGCIVAERCNGLRIEGASFDGYFAQRLLSTAAAENPSDWLVPHDNDQGQWLAHYGAAISLTDCSDVVVAGCRARRGQNGLLLTRCERAQVYDNDFSFLSGWGIALYRSSDNVIARNRADYCVRGYSHEVYWRGQDSAGILLFERCSDNLIAMNSATHSGDGLFLFAGRDLVDGQAAARGEQAPGGCDRNLIFQNDFSYAVANGIETTFSSENRVLDNLAVGCRQHGLWGGYSRRMAIAGNDFSDTQGGGITIEHGQECRIARNVLHGCEIGVELYWDEDPEFVNGPFGARSDTASRDHWLVGNSFADNDADLAIQRTTGLCFVDNVCAPGAGDLHLSEVELARGEELRAEPKDLLASSVGLLPSGRVANSTVRAPQTELPSDLAAALEFEPPELPGRNTPIDRTRRRGLETIVVGEWGPWDFESGEARPSPREPGGALAGASWSARWFSWAGGPDPRGTAEQLAAWRALAADPLVVADVSSWSSPWAGRDDLRRACGSEKFGLRASTSLELAAGTYLLRVTSDDGVRVSIDGRVVLENWTWHAATLDEARLELAAGRHVLELEYFQLDGAAALTVDLQAQTAR